MKSIKTQNITLAVVAGLMIFVSVYMTGHFFEVRYPKGLSGGSICNINEFFNCDKVTNSPMAIPFNIPTSVFGGLIGLFILAGLVLKSQNYQKTLYTVLMLNLLGCIGLFFYSLIAIQSICLFCSLYYVVSGIAAYVYYQKGLSLKPAVLPTAVMALVLGVGVVSARSVVMSKNAEIAQADVLLKESVLSEFAKLEKLNFDHSQAVYKLNVVKDAPLQMVIFSDFECPACRMLSEQIPEIIQNYKDKIDISYYFYPLDQACNPNVKRRMHEHACKAASIALCSPDSQFYQLHDLFFQNQNSFAQGFVEKLVTQNKLESCVNSPETKEKLQKIIKLAESVQVHSTPTFLLNGAKFEGGVPFYKLKIIMDSLLDKPTQ